MRELLRGLRASRRLVEQGWTQNAVARDHEGLIRSARSGGAVYFCAEGALERGFDSWKAARDLGAVRLLWNETGHFRDIVAWNDAPDRTQADVLAAFDRAIAAAEAAR